MCSSTGGRPDAIRSALATGWLLSLVLQVQSELAVVCAVASHLLAAPLLD